jgi:hypothetical protein
LSYNDFFLNANHALSRADWQFLLRWGYGARRLPPGHHDNAGKPALRGTRGPAGAFSIIAASIWPVIDSRPARHYRICTVRFRCSRIALPDKAVSPPMLGGVHNAIAAHNLYGAL